MTSDMDTAFRVLVVGTRTGSFGHYVADAFLQAFEDRYLYPEWSVVRAGIDGESVEYNVLEGDDYHDEKMREIRPHHVVYCAGVNEPDVQGALANWAHHHMTVNLYGFLAVAEAFKSVAMPGSHLVAVSSNSARIPRSPSVGYCASKAALSMAVRTLGRRWRGEPLVWGVEPGLMNTQATIDTVNAGGWAEGKPTHRMLGVSSQYGLQAAYLARSIVHDVLWGGQWLNGTLQQMDAGEL